MKRKGCYDCCKDVVHPDRKYSLCLDCLIKKLKDSGVIELPMWYMNETHYDDEVGEYEPLPEKIISSSAEAHCSCKPPEPNECGALCTKCGRSIYTEEDREYDDNLERMRKDAW